METKQKNNLIFWNVDTQYDFMRKDGKLYVQGAETIEPNLKQLTNLANRYNLKVVNTADWHNETSKEISANPDFKSTFPEHCIQGSQGARFIGATTPVDPYRIYWSENNHKISSYLMNNYRDIILYKDAFDVFIGNPHTEEVLEILNPKSAVVYGVATNVCVNYAVEGLLKRNVKVYVPLDAIKELPNLPLEPVLDAWKNAGAILIKTEDLEKIINGGQ